MVEVDAINQANHDLFESVVTLFNGLHQCHNLESIGNHFLQFAQSVGYECCLQIRGGKQPINLSHRGSLADLEQKILDYLNLNDRYIPFSQRLVINLPTVSVLLKNLPDNESDAATAQDELTRYMQILECAVSSFNTQQKKDNLLKARVTHVTEETKEVLSHINHHFNDHKLRSQSIMSDILCRIELCLAALDLDQTQEEQILELVTEAGKRLEDVLDDSAIIESEVRRLLEQGEHILDGTTD